MLKIIIISILIYVVLFITYGIGHWKGWRDCSKFYRGENDARLN